MTEQSPDPAEAMAQAEEQKREVEARSAGIKAMAAHMRRIREENHFAELIRRALGGTA